MNIAKIFCQSPGVSSHAKTFLMVSRFRTDSRSNEFGIRLNGSGYPFQKKKIVIHWNGPGYLLEKKCRLFERLGLSVWKKLLSVWTAMAILSKKKLSTVRATEAICSKINFSQVFIPKQFRRYPFTSNDLLFLSGHVTKFVYKRIMNTATDLCSFVAIFAFILSFDYRQYRHTFYSILKGFFNRFPENNIIKKVQLL